MHEAGALPVMPLLEVAQQQQHQAAAANGALACSAYCPSGLPTEMHQTSAGCAACSQRISDSCHVTDAAAAFSMPIMKHFLQGALRWCTAWRCPWSSRRRCRPGRPARQGRRPS
jgi:hypothetical protein